MTKDATQDPKGPLYVVVRNKQNQHSVWSDGEAIPEGWTGCGFCGSRQDCLDYIDATWRDTQLITASSGEALLSGVIE